MRREDLSAKRPWRAVPERTGVDSPWKVVAPRRYVEGQEQLVASILSEGDARTVAASHEALDVLQRILEFADMDEIRSAAAEVMRKYEGFNPAAEDERHAQMGNDS